MKDADRVAGFSLLETILSVTLAAVIFSLALSLFTSLQTELALVSEITRRDVSLTMAPMLFVQLLAHAGNNQTMTTEPALGLAGGDLTANSDLTGPDGFPDQALDDPFERLSLRQQEDLLRLKSGNGNYQPLLQPITRFEAERSTIEQLQLTVASAARISTSGRKVVQEYSFHIFLPNFAPSLFERIP